MAGIAQEIKDPILSKIRTALEAKLPPEIKSEYQKIVVAGLKLMFDDATHQMMVDAINKISTSGNIPALASHAIVKMISIIHNESQGKMSTPAATPAGITLMCYALEFLEETKGVQVTKEMVAQGAKAVAAGIMKLFNITADKVKQAVQQGPPKPGAVPPGAPPAAPVPPGAPPAAPVPPQGVV